jgi:hypothetical protein
MTLIEIDNNTSGILITVAGDMRAMKANIKASTPSAKSGINFFLVLLWVGSNALLNTNRPNKILSIPMDNSATESTVTITSAERVGNPKYNTREDSMSETIPDPICTVRNQLGDSYLSNTN